MIQMMLLSMIMVLLINGKEEVVNLQLNFIEKEMITIMILVPIQNKRQETTQLHMEQMATWEHLFLKIILCQELIMVKNHLANSMNL